MGNFLNRGKLKPVVPQTLPQQPPPPTTQEPGTPVTSQPPEINSEDAIVLERMRNALKKDVETFILNNLLMSVQFFENFERDMSMVWKSTLNELDTERNRRLAPHERKCISPDKLHELVAQRVLFRPRHGSQKHSSQTLTNQRLYIVHQNIELCESLEDSHYSSVDGPNYYLATEAAANTGYLKLRCDEKALKKRRNTYETIDDDDKIYVDPESNEGTPIYGEGQSVDLTNGTETPKSETNHDEISRQREKHPRPNSDSSIYDISNIKMENEEQLGSGIHKSHSVDKLKNSKHKAVKKIRLAGDETEKRESDSSGYKSSSTISSVPGTSFPSSRDSDYGYTTIQNLTTPRNLNEFRLGRIPANSAEIPYECFQTIRARAYGRKHIKGKKELFETKCYLKSDAYMCNFVDLFVDRLSEALGYDRETVDMAKKCGPKIYCDIYYLLTQELPYTRKIRNEIIPAIQCDSWPKQAEEWIGRYREPRFDAKEKIYCRWPTEYMVRKIKKMGCHLIPVGHLARRGDDRNRIMEWQVVFPEVEQYMEKCLRHAHIRCYLFAMAVYKSFLEPLDAELGLLPSHIRALLFWQCEKNYTAWPEDRQGETFRKFLERIYDALQHRYLQDYFIQHQNLIDSMPEAYIYAVQEKIYRIKENLTMYMIIALRNLQYTEEKSFYPVLDYKKLYEIMTTEDLLPLANPRLVANGPRNFMDESSTLIVHETENEETAIDMMSTLGTSNPVQEYSVQARRQIEAEQAANKLAAEMMRRTSVESIDVKIHLKKGTDPLRRFLLLKFFIPHFIEMAKKSNTFRATKQAEMYLKHAERLTILFQEEGMDDIAAREFLYNIKRLQEAARNTPVKPTETPHTSRQGNIAFAPPPKREMKKESPQVVVRGRIPLPSDTVSHPEIDTQSVMVTKVDVHKEPQYMKNGSATKLIIHKKQDSEEESSDEETSL